MPERKSPRMSLSLSPCERGFIGQTAAVPLGGRMKEFKLKTKHARPSRSSGEHLQLARSSSLFVKDGSCMLDYFLLMFHLSNQYWQKALCLPLWGVGLSILMSPQQYISIFNARLVPECLWLMSADRGAFSVWCCRTCPTSKFMWTRNEGICSMEKPNSHSASQRLTRLLSHWFAQG